MGNRLSFFLGEFHQGTANQILHFIGFAFVGYGVGVGNIWYVAFSGVLMMAGNLVNYAQGRYRKEFWETIPLQIVGWLLFVGAVYLISSFL